LQRCKLYATLIVRRLVCGCVCLSAARLVHIDNVRAALQKLSASRATSPTGLYAILMYGTTTGEIQRSFCLLVDSVSRQSLTGHLTSECFAYCPGTVSLIRTIDRRRRLVTTLTTLSLPLTTHVRRWMTRTASYTHNSSSIPTDIRITTATAVDRKTSNFVAPSESKCGHPTTGLVCLS